MKYKDWLYDWLNNYVKPTSKATTVERYLQIINCHIVGSLGDLELEDLTPLLLQKHISRLMIDGNKNNNKPLSANSVNAVISVIQNSLKTAFTLGLTGTYTANKIVRPKIYEKQVSCFSITEQKIIENVILSCKKKKLYGIIICMYTGLRIGELLALEFDDIDFDKSLIHINKTCHDSNAGRVIDTPKTESSIRIVPLSKPVLRLIKDIKKCGKCNYIIADRDKPVSVRSYQRSFELLLKKLQIPHKGFHSLRHTFATRALECGMDVRTLSEILGHKNTSVTLNRYVHSLMEHKQDMMNKLGKLLER
jgi:integrase